MTTITIKDAAILAHLSKQPSTWQRRLLTRQLSTDAKLLALSLINRKRLSAKRAKSAGRNPNKVQVGDSKPASASNMQK